MNSDRVPVTPEEKALEEAEINTSLALAAYYRACVDFRLSRENEELGRASKLSIRDTLRLCGFHILANIVSQALMDGIPPAREPVLKVFRMMVTDVTEHLEGMFPDIVATVQESHSQSATDSQSSSVPN